MIGEIVPKSLSVPESIVENAFNLLLGSRIWRLLQRFTLQEPERRASK